MPSTRLSVVLASFLTLLSVAGVAAAQSTTTAPQLSPLLRLTIALAVNGVVGLLVVAVAPDYTESAAADVREFPAETFLWGLLAGVGGLIALFVLAVTVVGLLVAIPGAFAYLLVAVVGGVVGTVALGAVVADAVTESTLFVALAVGVVASSLLSLVPFVGDVVNLLLGTVGMGAVARRYWRQRGEGKRDDESRSSGSQPPVVSTRP
ncbi:hypothetical protein SAMN04487948_10654 [Halogranum amylolyticum]|uniref:DUF8173 domain-containing protein n=1 Tax=Halogranum amylolyticum TaxID=660520 RepID=A0A1H8T6Y9_9EURY|nr:hypothetical protein [Halogranum amylolyticum]SEO86692.1 hypothetical protein SAMN04487948_10654 [Halogranum amylolyticum]